MNPLLVNYLILLLSVVLLSLLQTRFKIVTENPLLFFFFLIMVPIMVIGKMKKINDWDIVMYFMIATYTLMMAYTYNKHLVPKINEGFVLAYTLIFWYFEITTIYEVGLNFWSIVIPMIAVYPTYLVFKASFEDKILPIFEKRIMIIWFYFMAVYIYIDQIIMSQTVCFVHMETVDFISTFFIIMSAIKLYFISCLGCLVFIAIPVFHLDRSGGAFKQRWADAMNDWRNYMKNAAHNFIDYQITAVQAAYIILITLGLIILDFFWGIRFGIIEIYITIIPMIIFYLKLDVTKLEEI